MKKFTVIPKVLCYTFLKLILAEGDFPCGMLDCFIRISITYSMFLFYMEYLAGSMKAVLFPFRKEP